MRARSHAALPLAALAAGALLAACGTGLYDATGVPVVAGGDTCGADQISCGGVCTTPSTATCGAACADCTATVTPPAHGAAACLGSGAAGACGYACTDGFLKCAGGCCGAAAVAAGDAFTCALLDGGEVACWGANEAGQVGDGTSSASRPAPHLLSLGAPASALAAGAQHACAVVPGAVRCWGADDAGQAPATVSLPSAAVALAAGAKHTCALLDTGDVRCWGSNASGQLGPAQPVVTGASALVAGRDHACALVSGAVRCWGSNASGQLGASPSGGIATAIPSGIQLLAAGGDQTCAATGTSGVTTPDDALRCWGDSVGAGWLLAAPQPTPAIPMKDATTATVRYDVALVAAGGHHVCVRKRIEAVECLGANDQDQLGNGLLGPGETAVVPLPTAVAPAVVAVAVAAGASHTCAALGDGRLRCWGANAAGQLGDGTTVKPGLGQLAIPLGR